MPKWKCWPNFRRIERNVRTSPAYAVRIDVWINPFRCLPSNNPGVHGGGPGAEDEYLPQNARCDNCVRWTDVLAVLYFGTIQN